MMRALDIYNIETDVEIKNDHMNYLRISNF